MSCKFTRQSSKDFPFSFVGAAMGLNLQPAQLKLVSLLCLSAQPAIKFNRPGCWCPMALGIYMRMCVSTGCCVFVWGPPPWRALSLSSLHLPFFMKSPHCLWKLLSYFCLSHLSFINQRLCNCYIYTTDVLITTPHYSYMFVPNTKKVKIWRLTIAVKRLFRFNYFLSDLWFIFPYCAQIHSGRLSLVYNILKVICTYHNNFNACVRCLSIFPNLFCSNVDLYWHVKESTFLHTCLNHQFVLAL